MAKIGTAHVEIKPVLNQDALAEVCSLIEARIADAVAAGLSRAPMHLKATILTCPTHGRVPARAGSEQPGARWAPDMHGPNSGAWGCTECQRECAITYEYAAS